jgi:leucyl/phenylalanyl-tRNA--protein transferase
MGWAHSVEAWDRETGTLAGGLYGVGIDGFFAGESMFHRDRDASKVALVGLVERLRSAGAVLLDVQWLTPHLASLGAIEVPREQYLQRLETALRTPANPFVDA